MATPAAPPPASPAALLRHARAVQAVCFLPARRGATGGATGGAMPMPMPAAAEGAAEGAAREAVVTGDASGALRVWDAYTRRATATREDAHSGEFGVLQVTAVAAAADDALVLVLSQGRDGVVRAWIGAELDPKWSVQTGSFGFCKISANFTHFACPLGEDGDIALWDLANGEREVEIAAEDMLRDYVTRGAAPKDVSHREASLGLCMCLELQSSTLFVLYECGSLGVYEVAARAWALDLCLHGVSRDVPIALAVVPAAEDAPQRFLGAAVGADPEFSAFYVDMGTRKAKRVKRKAPLREAASTVSARQGASGIAVRADLDLAVVACWDGSVRSFQWSTLAPQGVLRQHKGAVADICLSTSPVALVAAASEDGNVSLIPVRTS